MRRPKYYGRLRRQLWLSITPFMAGMGLSFWLLAKASEDWNFWMIASGIVILIATFGYGLRLAWIWDKRTKEFRCPDCGRVIGPPAIGRPATPILFICTHCGVEWDTGMDFGDV